MNRRLSVLSVLILLCAALGGQAVEPEASKTRPTLNGDKRWRIAYYQGGDYADYHDSLVAVARGLMKLGWIESAEIPDLPTKDSEEVWRWLANAARSDFIEFAADGFYSSEWDAVARERIRGALVKRLNQPSEDIDLVLAMGTWAGVDLATVDHRTPITVITASDPLNAGIVASTDDSGFDHVHAQIDPWLYPRQIRLFHDAVGFRRLGIAYENTRAGQSYAALEHVATIAAERDFSVEHCHTQSDIPDQIRVDRSALECYEWLATRVDAIYVTAQGGVNGNTIPSIVRIALRHRVPTFSQHGADETAQGILLSMSQADFTQVGAFHADAIAEIFNGTSPRELPLIFENEAKLAINLQTASALGFIPQAAVLVGADEIY